MITLYAYRSSELSTYYAVMLCFICLINVAIGPLPYLSKIAPMSDMPRH